MQLGRDAVGDVGVVIELFNKFIRDDTHQVFNESINCNYQINSISIFEEVVQEPLSSQILLRLGIGL